MLRRSRGWLQRSPFNFRKRFLLVLVAPVAWGSILGLALVISRRALVTNLKHSLMRMNSPMLYKSLLSLAWRVKRPNKAVNVFWRTKILNSKTRNDGIFVHSWSCNATPDVVVSEILGDDGWWMSDSLSPLSSAVGRENGVLFFMRLKRVYADLLGVYRD